MAITSPSLLGPQHRHFRSLSSIILAFAGGPLSSQRLRNFVKVAHQSNLERPLPW
jgi:hypothetical protein